MHRAAVPLFGILLLTAGWAGPSGLLADPHDDITALHDDPGAVRVPGTQETDVLANATRDWSVAQTPGQRAHEPVISGESEDPRFGVLASAVFADTGMIEAVFLQRQDDALRPMINVGSALSSIRFDPPLELDDNARIALVDVPRLPWEAPQGSNESRQDTRQLVIETETRIPRPGANGTSPPIATQTGNETEAGTSLSLRWRIEFTERPLQSARFGLHSPAAIRFYWELEAEDDETFPTDQEHLWRFRYDYDTIRRVVRPERHLGTPMDGAYLISQDHRAALRLSAQYTPQIPDHPKNETIRIPTLGVDVYPSAGDTQPGTEPAHFPPPLIVEGRVQPTGPPAKGYTLTGELAFHQAAGPSPGTGEDDPEGPAGPTWPQTPQPWHALLVLAAAALVVFPGAKKGTATNP